VHEELSFLDKLAQFSQQYALFAPVLLPVVYGMKKLYDYFQGVNRLAATQTEIVQEMKLQREKLDKMMDGDGVDLRVAPVIEQVKTMRTQIDRIYDHLLNPSRKRRSDDQQ
jgi:cell division FtsZ-interacting protein ZapD